MSTSYNTTLYKQRLSLEIDTLSTLIKQCANIIDKFNICTKTLSKFFNIPIVGGKLNVQFPEYSKKFTLKSWPK